jgi:uncharacterized NAD(P)/FAD-binding protein YdhS
MPDPFTILSLAATIVQFVDVGCKLASGTKEIFDSADGLKKETAELKELVDDIKGFNGQLINSFLSKDEKSLRSLVKICEEVAGKLEKRLSKLMIRDDARFRIVESVRVSFESVSKSKDMKILKERLLEIQTHVQQRLAVILQR